MSELPLLLEPELLEQHLGRDGLLIVDLSKASTHQQAHIPGAVFLDYSRIIANRKPAMGLLPSVKELEEVLSQIGIGNETHIVAYDDEGGGKASRLLWTLETLGHNKCSLLNGGLHAWTNEGHPLEQTINQPVAAEFKANPDTAPVADARYIMQHLDSDDRVLLDTRSPDEYNGIKRFAEKAGHIPGAVNMDWILAMDQGRNLRLKPREELQASFSDLGIDPAKEIITYCHTHHRSAFTYMVLKILGYPRVKGYPGSWSDWGNRSDTPVA